MLGKLRRLAFRQHEKPRGQLLAARERHREPALAGGRDLVHVLVAKSHAKRRGLRARDLLELGSEDLGQAEVVAHQRVVHRGRVLAEHDHVHLVLGEEQRRAEAAGAVADHDHVGHPVTIDPVAPISSGSAILQTLAERAPLPLGRARIAIRGPARRTILGPPRRTILGPARRTILGPARRTILGPARRTIVRPARRAIHGPARRTILGPARRTILGPARCTIVRPARLVASRLREIAIRRAATVRPTPIVRATVVETAVVRSTGSTRARSAGVTPPRRLGAVDRTRDAAIE